MSLFQSEFKESNHSYPPDHIYLNGSLYNDNYVNPSLAQYVPAEISQTRTSQFLANSSAFNVAITRFAISSDCIPRVTQPLNTTPANTYWFVSLSYNGVYYDAPVVIPTSVDPKGQPAKVLYSVQAFLDFINDAWLVAQNAAQAAGAPTGPGQIFFSYGNSQGFYDLNIPSWYGLGITGNVPSDGIGVHMSLGLYGLFGSYNAILPRGPNITYNNHEVTFIRELTGFNYNTNVTYPAYGTTGDYIQLQQDVPLPSSIMNVHRLVITTNLPIYPSFTAPIFTSNLTEGGNNTLKMLTDFYIGHDGSLEQDNGTLKYVATGLLRLVSLAGSVPVQNWDLKVFYVTAENEAFPLYIPPGGELSIDLLFLKKGLTS